MPHFHCQDLLMHAVQDKMQQKIPLGYQELALRDPRRAKRQGNSNSGKGRAAEHPNRSLRANSASKSSRCV